MTKKIVLESYEPQGNIYQFPSELVKRDYLDPASEVLEKRRRGSKTYQVGEDKFTVINVLGATVHYKEDYNLPDSEYKEIDLTIKEENGKIIIDKAPYILELQNGVIGYSYTSRQGGKIDVKLDKVGNSPSFNINPNINGNVVGWKNVASGVDMKLVLRPNFVEIFKLIKNNSAPRKFIWKVNEEIAKNPIFQIKTGGIDNNGDNLQIKNNIVMLSEDNDKKEYFFEEEWTGRVSRIVDKKTRRKDWFDDVIFPVEVDASTTEDIVAGEDDVVDYYTTFFKNTSLRTNRTVITGGANISAYYYPGFRFQTLAIPQGSTIDSAKLVAEAGSTNSSGAKIDFYADDVDDAASWTVNNGPRDITKTTASQRWTWDTVDTISTVVTSIVQEIISRAGWSSNNDIRFAGFLGAATDDASVIAYENAFDPPVSLEVTYTAGGGGGGGTASDRLLIGVGQGTR